MNAPVTASPGPIEWLGAPRGPAPVVEVGGKAASLDRLARDGFLIPPGFCLTTAAFAAHVAAVAERTPLGEHPVTGREDQLVINAVRGLGEPMVSGAVTPDTYVVDKASGDVRDFSPGDGGDRLLAVDGRVTLTFDRVGGAALAGTVLRDLVALSLRVEGAFGASVDIEAAYARDRWYLLQARPITTA